MTVPPGLNALPWGHCQFPFPIQVDSQRQSGSCSPDTLYCPLHWGHRQLVPFSLNCWAQQQQPASDFKQQWEEACLRHMPSTSLDGDELKCESHYLINLQCVQCGYVVFHDLYVPTHIHIHAYMSLLGCNINVFYSWFALKNFEICWAQVHKSKVTSKPIVHLYVIRSQVVVSNNVRVLTNPNTKGKCSGSLRQEGELCGIRCICRRKTFRATIGSLEL